MLMVDECLHCPLIATGLSAGICQGFLRSVPGGGWVIVTIAFPVKFFSFDDYQLPRHVCLNDWSVHFPGFDF